MDCFNSRGETETPTPKEALKKGIKSEIEEKGEQLPFCAPCPGWFSIGVRMSTGSEVEENEVLASEADEALASGLGKAAKSGDAEAIKFYHIHPELWGGGSIMPPAPAK